MPGSVWNPQVLVHARNPLASATYHHHPHNADAKEGAWFRTKNFKGGTNLSGAKMRAVWGVMTRPRPVSRGSI